MPLRLPVRSTGWLLVRIINKSFSLGKSCVRHWFLKRHAETQRKHYFTLISLIIDKFCLNPTAVDETEYFGCAFNHICSHCKF